MRDYNSSLPLIVIHIPKTAGVSSMEIFKGWFGDGFFTHYKDAGKLPQKHDLSSMNSGQKPTLIYGHFNSLRHFGIEKYYPEVEQFITILRDPFERAISRYFYLRRGDSSVSEYDLHNVLLNLDPELSMFTHFPQKVTMDNYKDIIETQFIEIGVMEYLDESMKRISKKLNKQFDSKSLRRLNVTKRDSTVPYELREEFIEKNPLAYTVYNYVLSKYT